MSTKLAKSMRIALLAACAFAGATAPAHAYLDPGAGSLLLQGFVGAIAGGLFIFRSFWARIVSIFSFGAKKTGEQDADTAAESRD